MQKPPIILNRSHDRGWSFERCLDEQFAQCQAFEALADELPRQIDALAAAALAGRLQTTLENAHAMEEALIFPVLRTAPGNLAPILDRLRAEHFEDEDHACDVIDVIDAWEKDRSRASAEQFGHMLRCLFRSLGRHLAFDRDYVLPLYRRTGGQ